VGGVCAEAGEVLHLVACTDWKWTIGQPAAAAAETMFVALD